MIITIIAFIIVFGVLVFVHEFGHYFFAKKAGILVREFSIGMGPKLWFYRKNSTTYTIRLLPIGGYVRMAGAEEDDVPLKKGMTVNLLINDENKVVKINTSNKKTLISGVPVQISDWDLEDKLWIEGYENGDDSELKVYEVDHDACIIENDGTEVQIAPKDVQFQSAKIIQRMLTNFAGPMNNFILAIVAFLVIALVQGGVASTDNQIGKVQENSVAQKAGIKPNDRIIAVGNIKTTTWQEASTQIQRNGNKKIILKIDRKNKIIKIRITPKVQIENGKKVGMIGVMAKVHYDKSIVAILSYGFTQTWYIITSIIGVLGKMFTQGFSLNDLGGPVAMYSYTSEAAHYGILSVMNLMAVLSINLGIVNLLPIPALDGGKLLLNIVEAIRRKPLDPEKEGIITLVGFGFLMILMILVTWNDIQRYFLH